MSDTLSLAWPQKEGEFFNEVMDSARWNGFAIRDDDVIVATYAKAGTTLTQQILAQILFGPDPALLGAVPEISPWLELRTAPCREMAEAQTRRRILKTHLARQNLPVSPKARYVVVMRDVRDVAWSFHNHLYRFTPEHKAQLDGANPGRFQVPADVRAYYHAFLDGPAQTQPFWPFVQGWWDLRALPNVRLIHYADLIADMPGHIRSLAEFVGAPADEASIAAILPFCHIDHMRRLGLEDGRMDQIFQQGAATFFNKGVNGRWREVLTQAEIDKADAVAARGLTPDCAAWLRDGGPLPGP